MNPFMIQWEVHIVVYPAEEPKRLRDKMFVAQANTQQKARRSVLENCWKKGFYVKRIRKVRQVKK